MFQDKYQYVAKSRIEFFQEHTFLRTISETRMSSLFIFAMQQYFGNLEKRFVRNKV